MAAYVAIGGGGSSWVPVLVAVQIAQNVVLAVLRLGEGPVTLEGLPALEVVHYLPDVAWYVSLPVLDATR